MDTAALLIMLFLGCNNGGCEVHSEQNIIQIGDTCASIYDNMTSEIRVKIVDCPKEKRDG